MTATPAPATDDLHARARLEPDFRIQFTGADRAHDQDEEEFEFEYASKTHRLRIHDYDRIFRIPGLYEALVYDRLRCRSPQRLIPLLKMVLEDWNVDPGDLRALDLGAGNGVVAERLRGIGVRHAIGVDLLVEAKEAAERDRPGIYDDYLAADLTNLAEDDRERLRSYGANLLVAVASLGFGDIPREALASAFNFVEPDGWFAITIKEDFLDPSNDSGFGRMLRRMMSEGIVKVQAQQRFTHRVSAAGHRLVYVALVARKARDIPRELLADDDASAEVVVPGGVDPALVTSGG